MKVETLEELKAAFCLWRSKKRHLREPVPSDLRERAHRAFDVYGVGVVAMATNLDQTRLKAERTGRERSEIGTMAPPPYSRMALALPVAVAAERPSSLAALAGIDNRSSWLAPHRWHWARREVDPLTRGEPESPLRGTSKSTRRSSVADKAPSGPCARWPCR